MRLLSYILTIVTMFGAGYASAADMPVKYVAPAAAPIVQNWAGYYIGVEGGWLFDSPIKFNAAGVTLNKVNPRGGVIGGYVGHNWQVGILVLGLEANADWAGHTTSATIEETLALQAKVDYFGSVAGRVGLSIGTDALIYVKGGLGLVHATGAITEAGATLATAPAVHFGPMAGLGLDYRLFGGNWVARVSWEHYAAGKATYAFGGTATVNVPASLDLDVIKAGLAYKF
jgi:outer membrane immunogenic protein